MRSRLLLSVLLAAVLVIGTASFSLEQSGVGYTEKTIDGTVIRTYTTGIPPEMNPYTVESGIIYGTNQSADTYLLGRLRLPVVDDNDGNLYVYDSMNIRIHHFGPGGGYLGAFGREGEGPGEFRNIGDLTLTPNAIYCWSIFQSRLSVFDREGRFQNSIQIRDSSFPRSVIPILSDATPIGYVSFTRLGNFTFLEWPWRSVIRLWSDSRKVIRTVLDTVIVQRAEYAGGRRYTMPHQSTGVHTDYRPGSPVAWSFGDTYEFHLFEPEDPDRERIVRIPMLGERVTTEIKRARYLSYGSDPEDQRVARRVLEFPKRLPVLRNLQWDGLGRLWVRHYAGPDLGFPNTVFDVFDRLGTWLFRQELPTIAGCTFSADAFYVVTEDDEGNPVIRQYLLIHKVEF